MNVKIGNTRSDAIKVGMKRALKNPETMQRIVDAARRGAITRTRSIAERFWEKVNKHGPKQKHMKTCCWQWIGLKMKNRVACRTYGLFQFGGKYGRTYPAHRVAWMIEHGKMPKNMVLHKCDNPLCVRYSHLKHGTAQDNANDMKSRNRPRGDHRPFAQR